MDAVALASLIRLTALVGRETPLVELRASLTFYPRPLVDEALCQLTMREDVYLRGEADQRRLTAEDRKSALVLGGTARHVLLITA
ncbi:hypothetical protein [Lentzea cavernae]|uniref:Uncharacterized protein n=1 Tax=Lentzea cavernae TaxID=2020703 RepID=A0ABQ3MTV7_9PSEU|nr:hypothetical protein [Lentzea cavernae]GHH57640.1 hypothetical protein GCM10017774_77500 [Lentzea cavernae]